MSRKNERYFCDEMDYTYAFSKNDIEKFMNDNHILELKVNKAKRVTGQGIFFCKYYFEPGEVGFGCGRDCEQYKPRNGKNGRCIHSGYCYEKGEEIIFNNCEIAL